jgi:AcrR family transcriptional regulator
METALPTRTSPGGRGARERILQAATILFHEHGINVTGVAELAAAAQVSSRTLYKHFASKDDVVLAYLERFEAESTSGAQVRLTDLARPPRERLLAVFDFERGRGAIRGCPFADAAVEVADPQHPVHRLAADHKRRFTETMVATAREAGARDADRLGRRLVLLYDGAAVESTIFDDLEPAQEARAMAEVLIDAAIG